MRDSSSTSFLKSVLGDDGAEALRKANVRVPSLGAVLAPRTIISWLSTAVRVDYEGEIPGLENSYVNLQKSDDGYTGEMTVGDQVVSFDNSDVLHVAATIAVALGVDDAVDPSVKNTDISKLGKSIDLLVKARVVSSAVAQDLEKRLLDPNAGVHFSHQHHDLGGGDMLTHVKAHHQGQVVGEVMFEHMPNNQLKVADMTVHPEHRRRGIASAIMAHAEKATGKKITAHTAFTNDGAALWAGNAQAPQFGKVELTGRAAAPRGPKEPDAPQMPQSVSPSTNKTTKPPMTKTAKELSITKSEAENPCPECGLKQFRGDKFTGCMCFRALSKSVTTKPHADGYTLSLSRSQWDDETVHTFLSALKG